MKKLSTVYALMIVFCCHFIYSQSPDKDANLVLINLIPKTSKTARADFKNAKGDSIKKEIHVTFDVGADWKKVKTKHYVNKIIADGIDAGEYELHFKLSGDAEFIPIATRVVDCNFNDVHGMVKITVSQVNTTTAGVSADAKSGIKKFNVAIDFDAGIGWSTVKTEYNVHKGIACQLARGTMKMKVDADGVSYIPVR